VSETNTPESLDELPERSVVLGADGFAYQKFTREAVELGYGGNRAWWSADANDMPLESKYVAQPVTVLHVPKGDA